ncbi:hypothetical protein OROGR_011401 [Orobanche gracilis]
MQRRRRATKLSHSFRLKLRCKDVDPDDHPVKKEFVSLNTPTHIPLWSERLSLYQEKLQQCMDMNKAPLRPSITKDQLLGEKCTKEEKVPIMP